MVVRSEKKSITWISGNFLKFLNQSLSFKTSVNSSLLGKINAWFTLVIRGQRYFSPQAKYIKSSHWRCSVKKVFSKFRKFHRKTVLESLFDKFPGPYAWSFIKKRLQQMFRTLEHMQTTASTAVLVLAITAEVHSKCTAQPAPLLK